MAPRPLLPVDDLYARLELPRDASYEAVEVAWRALLKLHHPDVAGPSPAAEERAKRINVAHDWLSDPELRARYDRERHPAPRTARGSAATRAGPPPRAGTAAGRRQPRLEVSAGGPSTPSKPWLATSIGSRS